MKLLLKRLSLAGLIASVGIFLGLLLFMPQEFGIIGVTQIDHEAESAQIAPLPSVQAAWPYLLAQEYPPCGIGVMAEWPPTKPGSSAEWPDNYSSPSGEWPVDRCSACHLIKTTKVTLERFDPGSAGGYTFITASHSGKWENTEGLIASLLIFPFGLIVNAVNLSAVYVNLKTTFNKAFEIAPSMWDKVAMLVPSTSSSNDFKWLGVFPKMRKWIGEKFIKSLEAYKYQIVNDDYEATVAVNRNDIEDDTLGIYKPLAEDAGQSAKQLPDQLVFDVINAGFTGLCFDGKAFFATDHPNGDQPDYSNKITAALSASTQAAAQASLGAAAVLMRKFKDTEGNPLDILPDAILVPPDLAEVAETLYTAEKLEDGKPNLYKGKYKPIVSGRMTSTTAWVLCCTTKAVKPFVYQLRKAPVFVEQTTPDSDAVFMQKTFHFGAEARAAAGYGLPQLAVGSTGV